jgi:hypothetical protein
VTNRLSDRSQRRTPFNTWFREAMKEVHGVDISQPMPPVTKIMDVQLKD